jgi:hypothetical protein
MKLLRLIIVPVCTLNNYCISGILVDQLKPCKTYSLSKLTRRWKLIDK